MGVILMSAGKINDLLGEVSLPQETANSWKRVRIELAPRTKALGLEKPAENG